MTASGTSASCTMTSASCRMRWARSVRRSAAPGPAPTSQTKPCSAPSDCGQQARGEPARLAGPAGERRVGDAALEESRPEAPARLALRQHALGGGAEGIAEARQRAEPHRQHRLDAGAELLRQHRAGAGRA